MKPRDLGLPNEMTQKNRTDRKLGQKTGENAAESAPAPKYVAPSRKGKKQIGAWVPDHARTAFKIFCMERGYSVDQFIIEACDEKLINMGADFIIGEVDPMEKE